jgi:hypothetical protein
MMRMYSYKLCRVLENTKIRKRLDPLSINLTDPTFSPEIVMNLTNDYWKKKYICLSEDWNRKFYRFGAPKN